MKNDKISYELGTTVNAYVYSFGRLNLTLVRASHYDNRCLNTFFKDSSKDLYWRELTSGHLFAPNLLHDIVVIKDTSPTTPIG